MKFVFKAKNNIGEIKAGYIDAMSSEAAVELLQKNDLIPILVKQERVESSFEKSFYKYFDRVSEKELMSFFRQLSILVEARVPIVASLNAIRDEMDNKYLQKVLSEISNDIQDGLPLSDSLQKHKDVFSNLAINIVRAGELSGNLKKSLTYIADNIEKNYELTSKVKSAMIYPVIVMIVFFIIGFIVMSFVIPKLTEMIKTMDGVILPWYTSAIIAISDFMNEFWWAITIFIVAIVGSIMYYIKTEDGSREWDQIKIKLPVFGRIYQYLYVARFADNFGVLLVGGIPIIQALNIVSSVINNVVYEKIFLKAADEVRIGGVMSTVLRKNPNEIPSIVTQMVKIGEDSGQIDVVLGHVAKFYNKEATDQAKNLATLLEPILMVLIGIAVAFLAFAVLMPIYNIAGQL